MYPVDTTPFVRISIEEVIKTLLEAIALVFLVMYVFLQNLRATLIPTIAVPVVLLGTFGVLAAAGYSINTLTMFGMVLAIGLLVDDAIVVVENVERVMAEDGLGPKEATRRSMGQISGALVGIALVLAAVFVPMAQFPLAPDRDVRVQHRAIGFGARDGDAAGVVGAKPAEKEPQGRCRGIGRVGAFRHRCDGASLILRWLPLRRHPLAHRRTQGGFAAG